MKFSRQWWLACLTVVVAGTAAGVALRFALSEVRTQIIMASELKPSDPRYREVMCGPHSLFLALGRLGINRLPVEVASKCRVTSRGVALSDLERFANSIGSVAARSQKLTWNDLLHLEGVAVLFVDARHFVAADPREASADGSPSGRVRIYEQEMPPQWLSREELEQRWDGKALVITKAAIADDVSGPRIEWDACFIDHGILENRHAEYQFSLRNMGSGELSINQVTKSCGCTDYVLSQDYLKPGESAILKATVDLRGKEGHLHERLLVQTNDASHPESVLTITGWVPRTRVVSSNSIRLEDLPQGGIISREFYVADPGFAGCKIREARFSARSLDTNLHLSCSTDLELIGDNAHVGEIPVGFRSRHDYRVRLTFRADASCPTGSFEGEVAITVEAEGNITTHKVAILGVIVKDVHPIPRVALITLGQAPESIGSATIELHSYSNRVINVVRTGSDGLASLQITQDDENRRAGTNRYIITANMPEILVGRPPVKGTVSFELDDGSIVSVPVTVFRPPS